MKYVKKVTQLSKENTLKKIIYFLELWNFYKIIIMYLFNSL